VAEQIMQIPREAQPLFGHGKLRQFLLCGP
jgi:hypothetical protein